MLGYYTFVCMLNLLKPVAEDKADLKSKEKESVEKANKDNKENKQKSLSSGRPAFTRNNSSHSVSSQVFYSGVFICQSTSGHNRRP